MFLVACVFTHLLSPLSPQFSCCDATDVLTNVPHPASIWMNPACYACFCGSAEADKTLSALLASTNFCLLCIYGPCLKFPLIKCYISSLAHRVALAQNSFSLFSHSLLLFYPFSTFFIVSHGFLPSLCMYSTTLLCCTFSPSWFTEIKALDFAVWWAICFVFARASCDFLQITMHYTDTVKLLAQQIFNSYLQCFRLVIAQSKMS